MKNVTKAVALAILLTLLVSNFSLAGNYITDAANALQRSPVYVAPGIEGTDSDTAGKLQALLNSHDTIVLVMLPEDAQAQLAADPSTITESLSKQLGNQKIIGLTIGSNPSGFGYAPTLPIGVATDLMRRATSVSNDPVTTLSTFAQNVHQWQAAHPQPKPTPTPSAAHQKQGGFDPIPLLVLACLAAVIGGLVIIRRRSIPYLLSQIINKSKQVDDYKLREVLYQLPKDVQRYLQSNSTNKKRDLPFFKDRLVEVTTILDRYLDVQNNHEYYYHPSQELQSGKQSITDFSTYVLDLIRMGNSVDSLDFELDMAILHAPRKQLRGR